MGNGNYLGQTFEGVQPCPRCHGKGFLNADGTANNAFLGSDQDPVMSCPDCDAEKIAAFLGTGNAAMQIKLDVEKERLKPKGDCKLMPSRTSREATEFIRIPDDEGIAPLKRRDGSTCSTKRGTDGFGSTGR
jgi:hypothetical protein